MPRRRHDGGRPDERARIAHGHFRSFYCLPTLRTLRDSDSRHHPSAMTVDLS